MRSEKTLQDFLHEFADDHTAPRDGSELLLRVSIEDAQSLGLFFIRGVCGWLRAQDAYRRRLMELEAQTGVVSDTTTTGDGNNTAPSAQTEHTEPQLAPEGQLLN